MDVLALDAALIDEYQRFARSFTHIRSVELQRNVDALYAGRRFWPEPLLQLNPHYETGGSIARLVSPGGSSAECAPFCRAVCQSPRTFL